MKGIVMATTTAMPNDIKSEFDRRRADAETEAKRLACSHLLDGGRIKEIGKKKKG